MNNNTHHGSEPLVSIISAAYNVEKFIGAMIESIQAQTYQNWELIVVDDASKDSTANVIESFTKKDPWISLIRRTVSGGGPGPALNEAIRAARGGLVAVQDSDDISLPTRIAKQVTFLESNTEYDGVSCAVELVNEDATKVLGRKTKSTDQTLLLFSILLRPQFIHGCMMIRRQAIIDIGGYDPSYVPVDDYEIQCRLIAKGKKLSNLDEVLYKYRMRGMSITHYEGYFPASERLVTKIMIRNISPFMPVSETEVNLLLKYITGQKMEFKETFMAISLHKKLARAYVKAKNIPKVEMAKIFTLYKNERNYHLKTLITRSHS